MREKAMKLHPSPAWLVALLSAGWVGGTDARAQGRPIADRDFMAEALVRGGAQARAAEMALRRGKAKEVREFARRVLARQRPLGRALEVLARDHDVPVFSNRVKGRRAADDFLGKLRGDAFDRAALRFLTNDLEQLIDLAQRFGRGPGGPALRERAGRMLPSLRQSLKEARELQKVVAR
jgi:predicted outer membrane protein